MGSPKASTPQAHNRAKHADARRDRDGNNHKRREPIAELPPELDENRLASDEDAPITEDIRRGATPNPERAHKAVIKGNPGVIAAVSEQETGGEFAGEPDPAHDSAKRGEKPKSRGAQ